MKSVKHYASVSFGKDSLAMLFMLIEKTYPLDEVVFYNTGMEFQAIYDIRDQVIPQLNRLGIQFTELSPTKPFLYDMLERPVAKRGANIIHKIGYSWCGGRCRWGTTQKLKHLKNHTKQGFDYVGIAVDETHRIHKEKRENRILPLYEWGITEKEALEYCYNLGFTWEENGVRLYDILDRVSCWCCGNKNLKELYNYYLYLPVYWNKLKESQSKTDRPFRRDSGKTIFQLEEEFEIKRSQNND
ncbi:MAG: phosphoadenosine phosphosulfate reductase family protein [Tannerellaceae bacterium]|nr:phosphoadenosine phosphosulfate reductase family protein [Tannerellaceae bacterium]